MGRIVKMLSYWHTITLRTPVVV